MAYDLIFGNTPRDWSVGRVLSLADAKDPEVLQHDLFANRDVQEIAPLVRVEIQANYNTAFRLSHKKQIPVTERQAFGRFMAKWLDFNFEKDGKYGREDFVTLLNFREANKRFTERLAILVKLAETPLKTPVANKMLAKVDAGILPPVAKKPWAWLLGLGLGIAGLGFFGKKL